MVRVPGRGTQGAGCRVRSAGRRVQARLIERGARRRGVPVTLDTLVRGEDPAVGTPALELVVDEDAVISAELRQAAVRLCSRWAVSKRVCRVVSKRVCRVVSKRVCRAVSKRVCRVVSRQRSYSVSR